MGGAAQLDEWTGEDVSLSSVDRELARLRSDAARDGIPDLRTSVLTHVAWVPAEWEEQATTTLAGLDERHPSRALLLHPRPDEEDGIDAVVSLRCFALPGAEHQVCSEVIELRLRGRRAAAPASVVQPLVITGLPLFLRWRGEPPWGTGPFDELVEIVDRLVVDSGEWPQPRSGFARLAELLGRTAATDIAWARTLLWRRRLAQLWPGIAEVDELEVRGPEPEALLLAGWLRSRLRREVQLSHEPADALARIALDGEEVDAPPVETRDGSDLLSEELDRFGPDPVYEAALLAAA